MTLATTPPQVEYIENGVTLPHAVPFQFEASADLVCSRIAAGVETLLTLGADYTVAGGAGATGTVTKTNGGVNGQIFRIRRNTARAQSTDYTPGDAFPAETNEAALDRAMAIDQEQDVKIADVESRSLRFPVGEVATLLSPAAARIGKVLGFDNAGAPALLGAADFRGDPGSAGEGYASRFALAAVASPTNLDDAYLTEPGREGKFIFSSANLSAKVAADPYQGLYIAPASAPSGASGAWVRVVPYMIYHAVWWGITTALTTTKAILQSAVDVIPAGATFLMPPFDVHESNSDPRVNLQKPMHFTGCGIASGMIYTGPSGGIYWQLGIQSSDVEVDHLRFYGDNPNTFSGNPSPILIGLNSNPNYADPTEISRIRVHDNYFQHVSLAIVAFAHFVGDDADIPVPPRDIEIYDNIIETNMLGIEIFGANDVRVYRNTIRAELNLALPHFNAPIRILGSSNVDCFENDLTGASNGDQNAFGIYVAAANVKTTNGRMSNRNVRCFDNKMRRVGAGFCVEECRGELVIRNNNVDAGDDSGTTYIHAISVRTSTPTGSPALDQHVNNMIVTDNTFRGFATAWLGAAARVDTLVYERNANIGNNFAFNPAAAQAPFNMGDGSTGAHLARICHNSFLFKSQVSVGEALRLIGSADARFFVFDNMLPEIDPAVNMTGATQIGVYNGTAYTTRNGASIPPGFAAIGSNMPYVFGTHAAVWPTATD